MAGPQCTPPATTLNPEAFHGAFPDGALLQKCAAPGHWPVPLTSGQSDAVSLMSQARPVVPVLGISHMRSGASHTSHRDQQPPLDSGPQGAQRHEKGGRRKWAGHPQLVACWAGISWDPAQGPTAPGGHRGGWCPLRGGTRALGGLARAGCTSGGELGPFSPFSGLLNCFFLGFGKTHFLELLHRHPGAGADSLWVRVRRELGGRTPGVDGHGPTAVTPIPWGGQVHKRTEAGAASWEGATPGPQAGGTEGLLLQAGDALAHQGSL